MKEWVKRNLPFLVEHYHSLRKSCFRLWLKFASSKAIFSHIYEASLYGSDESRSGTGSEIRNTERIRRELPLLCDRLGVRTFLDVPCGDWVWMRQVDLGVETYIGADIVPELIENNELRYRRDGVRFVCLNLLEDDIPTADVVLLRDCLIHFSFRDCQKALSNLYKSGSKYLLTTTYPRSGTSNDILTGQFRPINLNMPPIGFPPPLESIPEKVSPDEQHLKDKVCCLWSFEELGSIINEYDV